MAACFLGNRHSVALVECTKSSTRECAAPNCQAVGGVTFSSLDPRPVIAMDDEVQDPKIALEAKCGASMPCAKLYVKYEECKERIEAKGSGECSAWYMDYVGCVDACVLLTALDVCKGHGSPVFILDVLEIGAQWIRSNFDASLAAAAENAFASSQGAQP
eukprot:6186884-Pleurochrysis_carterae.AAC.2